VIAVCATLVVLCLVIRFWASHGTMKRTKPEDVTAALKHAAVVRAQRAARRAQRGTQ
jgi:hypothetical protein